MNLPEQVKKIESQLTWLDNILSDCFEDSKEKDMWTEATLSWIKRKQEKDQHSECDNSDNQQIFNYGELVMQLTMATMSVNLGGDCINALIQVERIRNLLERQLTEVHEKTFKNVLDYFLNALAFSIFHLLRESPPLQSNFESLKQEWQQFQQDKKCLVVIAYVKATPWKLIPSSCDKREDMEVLLQSTFQLGMMLKDDLWENLKETNSAREGKVQPFRYSVDLDNMLKRCLSLFDDSIELAEKTRVKENHWAMESVVQKAKLHRKLGNVYRCGVVDEGGMELSSCPLKALEQFQICLGLQQRNFYQCLRDFIKLLKNDTPLNVTKEMLIYFNQFFSIPETLMKEGNLDENLIMVRIWKGFIIRIYNPEEDPHHERKACEVWLDVLENYPDFQETALKYIWNPELVHISCKICSKDLKDELGKIKEERIKKLAVVGLLLGKKFQNDEKPKNLLGDFNDSAIN